MALSIKNTSKEQPAQALEISNQAVWSLSSCKPGFGIAQLRDSSNETYWQSDGPQPHLISIEFMKKTAVRCISLYVDYKQDESYTPSKIAIRAGTNFHDLTVSLMELEEPDGWVDIDTLDKDERPVRAFVFQVAILANHQSGRDTHIRQIRVFEPELCECPIAEESSNFLTIEFSSMLTFR